MRHNPYPKGKKILGGLQVPGREVMHRSNGDMDFTQRMIMQSSGDVAFDIGANHGQYTKLLSERFKHVYAFEPAPDNIKIAKNNLTSNIILVERAISNTTGTCKLYLSEGSTGHSISEKIIIHPSWLLNSERFLVVPCITIDDFCEQRGCVPSFIKMDIEGGEAFVWEGAVKTLQDNKISIVLEAHRGVDVPKLEKFFANLGYTIKAEKYSNEWFNRQLFITK